MTKADIRTTVESHSCRVGAVTYRFSIQWAAIEKNSDAGSRVLLHVHAVPSVDEKAHSLHVMTSLESAGDLPALLNDALHHHLAEARSARRDREKMPA